MRAVSNTQSSVEMLVNQDRAAGQGPSPVHPLDLQSQVLKADGVIAVDGALILEREDQTQMRPQARNALPRCAGAT